MSAASSVPLPRPARDDDDGLRDAQRDPRGGARPRLAVAGPAAGSAASPAGGPAAASRAAAPATGPAAPADARSAPDPVEVRVQVRLVPRTEPPTRTLPADGPAHHRPPVLGSADALGRPRPTSGTHDADEDVAVGPLPDPTRLCCAVVQAAVEGLRGVRPLAQLTRWVTPEVYELLALRARLVQDAGAPSAGRAGIRRVRVFRIGDGAAEATVVVDDGPRVRAVAVRVEEHRGRWRATALEIG